MAYWHTKVAFWTPCANTLFIPLIYYCLLLKLTNKLGEHNVPLEALCSFLVGITPCSILFLLLIILACRRCHRGTGQRSRKRSPQNFRTNIEQAVSIISTQPLLFFFCQPAYVGWLFLYKLNFG